MYCGDVWGGVKIKIFFSIIIFSSFQTTKPPSFIFWYHNKVMINYDQQRGGITVTTKYFTINNTNETSYHEKNVTNEIAPASLVGKALANHEKAGSHGAKALANQRAVPHLTISHITITAARFADSGNYTCSAENTNATVRIYVSEGG